jgi:predicted CoA-binding protein
MVMKKESERILNEMGKYGEAAVKAVKLVVSGTIDYPRDAWEIATGEIFGAGTSSQRKGCPRNAFLGLCEEGKIKGIPFDNYTNSKKNKEYAIKAVQILQEIPALSSDPTALWNRVVKRDYKVHNQQMDVVTSLWNNNLIVVNTDLITGFLREQNVFAVIGVSKNPAKYGHQVYKDLKEAGYVVYAVNPNIDEVLGDRCYHALSELPQMPDVVDTVVPPAVTEKIVVECKELGIVRVWMQPGSESEKAINFCIENDIKVVHDMCVMVKRKE